MDRDPTTTNGAVVEVESEPELRLGNPVELLRRHLLVVSFCVAAGLALAFVYCREAPAEYQSSVQILVMQREATLPAESTRVGAVPLDERVAKDLLATHMEVLHSRRILEHAVENGALASIPSLRTAIDPASNPLSYLLAMLGIELPAPQPASPASEQRALVDYLRERLSVTAGGKGQAQTAQVLNVSIRHGSAEDSATILQAIVTSYEDFVRATLQDAGLEAATLIAEAKDELATDLRAKEDEYRRFREEAPLLAGRNESVNFHQARLSELERLLSDHRVRHAQLEERAEIVERAMSVDESVKDLDRMASIAATDVSRLAFVVGVEDAIDQDLRALEPAENRLLDLRLEAKRLEAELGPENPRLEVTRGLVGELEQFLAERRAALCASEPTPVRPAELMNAYLRMLRHDLVEMARRSEELERLAAEERARVRDLVAAEVREMSLRGELDRSRELFDGAVQRLQEINLLRNYGTLVTELISPIEPGELTWPKPRLALALGGVLGLLAGAALALLLELRDRGFRCAEDLRDSLRLEVLASVPELARPARRIRRKLRRGAASAIDPRVVTFHLPESSQAEAFRRLRTALFFAGRAQHKVLQITSPSTGDGKTTLAANLAVSIARAQKRVLVIDADLRRPAVGALLGATAGDGLTGCLSAGVDLEAAVQPTECPGLFVLPAGPEVAAPGELLSLARFDELLSAARKEYEFVLIDGPALEDLSDALAVAARAEGTLLQVWIGRTGRARVLEARSHLDGTRSALVGLAVRGALAGRPASST